MEIDWEDITNPPDEGSDPTPADLLERFVFSANALRRLDPKTDFSRRSYVPRMNHGAFPDSFLEDFLDDRSEERAKFRNSANLVAAVLEEDEESAYAEKVVRKNGKDRTIHSPDGASVRDEVGRNGLRTVQEGVRDLLNLSPLPDYVIGFRKGTDPYSALRKILDRFDTVGACLSIDVRNFFPSVTREMVVREIEPFLAETGIASSRAHEVAETVAKICTFRGGLVQGASSSPVIANMVALSAIDKKLRPLLADLPGKTAYFRYADDIVVLSDRPLSKKFREKFVGAARETGFEIAEEKTEYRENSAYYPVFGADIVGNENGAVRFRFPRRKARIWAKEILEASDVADYPSDTDEFLRDPRISRIVACLGHAAYVNRIGGNPDGSRSGRKRSFLRDMDEEKPNADPLRGELRHAWETFRRKFADRLPSRSAEWFSPRKK